jgi:hypothetical protein
MSTPTQPDSGAASKPQPASDNSLLGAKGDPAEGQRHIPEGPGDNDSDADEAAEEAEH